MSLIISSTLMSFFCNYAFSKLRDISISYYSVIAYSLLLTLTANYLGDFRTLFNFVFLILLNYIYYKESFAKTLIYGLVTFFIVAVSEIIVLLVLVKALNLTVLEISNLYYADLLINFSVLIIGMLFLNIPKIVNQIKRIEMAFSIRFVLFFLIVLSNFLLLMHFIYFDTSKLNILIINFVSFILVIYLYVSSIIEKSDRLSLKFKYEEILNDIKVHEDNLEKMRIVNHENINDLLIIRNKSDISEVVNFVDKILDSKKEVNICSSLPSGGIRGIIDLKKHDAELLNIKFNVFVDNYFKSSKTDELCKLLAIFLDNSIEAASSSVQKCINVGFYKEEVIISNSYKFANDVQKIGIKGFSTKGIGRGYGSYIARKIALGAKIKLEYICNDMFIIKIRNF